MSTRYEYDTEVIEERQLCDSKPTLVITVTERQTETWQEHDGSTVTKEHPPRVIATFDVNPNEEQG